MSLFAKLKHFVLYLKPRVLAHNFKNSLIRQNPFNLYRLKIEAKNKSIIHITISKNSHLNSSIYLLLVVPIE